MVPKCFLLVVPKSSLMVDPKASLVMDTKGTKRYLNCGSKKSLISGTERFLNVGSKKFLVSGTKRFLNGGTKKYKKLFNKEPFTYFLTFFVYCHYEHERPTKVQNVFTQSLMFVYPIMHNGQIRFKILPNLL